MRIIYVGKHDSGGNDDEGAIHFALEKLGHEVVRVREAYVKGVAKIDGDFLLCHHWHDLGTLERVKIPKVFWCFDLVSWPGGGARHLQREKWMTELTSICDLGFLTDGDWVAKDQTGKLYWLTQGADERTIIYQGSPEKTTDILFVGGVGYGRESFVQELRERYGERFKHILKGCHGVALADEINRAKIVVAPDSPVTDRYWSNRVYNILRLGGFLLHPWTEGLYRQYNEPSVLAMYKDIKLSVVIDQWLQNDVLRLQVAGMGQHRTMQYHTYRHRCISLIQTVKKELEI